jgi:hypothetical protein
VVNRAAMAGYAIGELVMDDHVGNFGVIIDVYESGRELAVCIKWDDKISVRTIYNVTPIKSIDGYTEN